METTVNARATRGVYKVKRHPVKLTALLYLREALLEERYEICPDLIQVALEFEANPYEIQQILESPKRTVRERSENS